jgi:hypothetical protein
MFYPSPRGSSERKLYLYRAGVMNAGRIASGGVLADPPEGICLVELLLKALRNNLVLARIHGAKLFMGTMWLLNRRFLIAF